MKGFKMANTTSADRNNQGTVAAITAGVTITGTIECPAELQIGGRVEGDVHCHTLFLEEDGAIVGDVVAERIRVAGVIEGTVEAIDVAIEPTGRVVGTITYGRLKVGAGGILEGTMKRRPVEASATVTPIPVESASLKLVDVAAAEPAKQRRVYVD